MFGFSDRPNTLEDNVGGSVSDTPNEEKGIAPFTLCYNCGPVSQEFHCDYISRVKLLIGPFGTGKTTSAAYDLIECLSKRVVPINGVYKSRFAVVRNTYPQLRDTTIKSYLDWFPPLYFGKYTSNDKIYLIKYDNCEIEIIFKALDSPQDVRDLLSLELTGAHVDEAREIHEDVLKGLLGRVGRYPSKKDMIGDFVKTHKRRPTVEETASLNPFVTPPQVLLTTNYPSTEHWLYRDFVSDPVDGYKIYVQGQDENKHNLRENYYEDLEKDYKHRPDLLKTLVRGEWGITIKGKIVFPSFNRAVHVSKEPLKPTGPTRIIRGWDNTGLNPAIILSYMSPTGRWFVFKEFLFENEGIMEATEALILWCKQELHPNCTYTDVADPAGRVREVTKISPADYIRMKAIEYGHNIVLIDGIQTPKVRREAVANRLNKMINGESAFLLDPSCTLLSNGFEGGYAFREIGNSGVFTDEPHKNKYSHPHDALQYAATHLFINMDESLGPISDFLANRKVPNPRAYS